MSWAVVAGAAISAVGTAYSSDQSRKNVHAQQDAQIAAQQADARQAAEAETLAAVAGNAKTADARRRRAGSVLASGAPATLAPSTGATVLGGGSIGPRPGAATTYGGTALGAGAPR